VLKFMIPFVFVMVSCMAVDSARAGSYLSDDLLATADNTIAPAPPKPDGFLETLGKVKLFPGHKPRNNWRYQVYFGAVEQKAHDETVVFITYAIENDLTDDLAVAAEFVGYDVNQRSFGAPNSVGVGFNLRLRDYHTKRGTVKFFHEVFMGVAYFNRRTPGMGSQFNFATGIGAGVQWTARAGYDLMVGIRYQHISNNDRGGMDENPGIDAFGGYVGFEIPF
jgi:hypothetical protein